MAAVSTAFPPQGAFSIRGRTEWIPVFLVIYTAAANHLPAESAPTLTCRTWQASSGLPDDKTTDIIQDAQGYVWAATHGGAARFDGVRFVNLTSSLLPLYGRKTAWTICADGDCGVWCGFEHGVIAHWSNGQVTVLGSKQGLPDDFPTSLCIDKEGSLFAAFSSGGCARIAGEKVTCYLKPKSLRAQSRGFVVTDRSGIVWGVLGNALMRFRNADFETVAKISRGQQMLAAARSGG